MEIKKIKIFATKNFFKWSKKEKLAPKKLIQAVKEVESGLIDGDLGDGLIKKRIARQGQGKSGGYRTLLAFKHHKRYIFMFGFSKNDRDNIDADEKVLYKKLAKLYLNAQDNKLRKMCSDGLLIEVSYEKD